MIPGHGHEHMNQLKTFFQVMSPIMLEPLGSTVLNFNSDKALKYFLNAKDTHKSYQALQILLFGTVYELIKNYLRKEEQQEKSPQNFLMFLADTQNPTIKLVGQLILNSALSIYLFKQGIRNNNDIVVTASRVKFMGLFFGFNHPYYREVLYRDMRNKVMYSDIISQIRSKYVSYSTSKLKFKSEGGDFKLESKVQRQKLLAPKGPTTSTKWQTINRALDEFDEVYGALSNILSMGDENGQHNFDFSDEIFMWRAVLRSSKMLSEENKFHIPRNIYGTFLSSDLLDLPTQLHKLRKEFFRQVENGTKIENVKYSPIKVTDREIELQLATFNIDN